MVDTSLRVTPTQNENPASFRSEGNSTPLGCSESEPMAPDSIPSPQIKIVYQDFHDNLIIDDADREVAFVIQRRRRKKGHGWSTPKGSYNSRARSRSAFSDTSDTSSKSNVSNRSQGRDTPESTTKSVDSGSTRSGSQSALSNSSKTTYATDSSYGSDSRARSDMSDSSKTTHPDYTHDDVDSQGLLLEHGVRIESQNRRGRKRKRRGHNWSRPKGARSRSRASSTRSSPTPRKPVSNTNTDARAAILSKKKLLEQQSNDVRLKNMFNDILAVKNNLRDFATAYLVQELKCYEFYHSDDENRMVPVIKTRLACKMRDEVIQAFKQKVYECSECIHCELQPEYILQHMINAHRCIPLYMCEMCALSFVLWDHYEIHKGCHNRIIAYCLFCSQEFVSRKLYEAHMDRYISCPFKCVYCGDIYLDRMSYRSHVRKRHIGMKFRIQKPKSCILWRVDYKPNKPYCNENYNEFVRILIQIDRSNNNTPMLDPAVTGER